MKEKKISVKEIAEMCNVSVATVSRVINQNGRFSPETEQRVKEVIEKYNFKPNQLAKGLRENKTNAIGIMVPDITNEYFAKIILSIQTCLYAQGYSLVIYNTNESREIEEQCISYLVAQNVSGIIIVNSKTSAFEQINKNIPIIYIDKYDNYTDKGNSVWISSDHFLGGYLAAEELINCNCKKPVMIAALKDSSVTKMRTQGFVVACKKYGIELPEQNIFYSKIVNYEEAYAIVEKMVAQGIEFDSMFCQTDWLAIGALEALMDQGLSVPSMVKLVGFDGISISRFGRVPITTVVQDTTTIGNQAAELLLAIIDGEKETKSRHIMIPVKLIRRESTKNDS